MGNYDLDVDDIEDDIDDDDDEEDDKTRQR